jgi:hypothetical protein
LSRHHSPNTLYRPSDSKLYHVMRWLLISMSLTSAT